jgi:hypothetical protein
MDKKDLRNQIEEKLKTVFAEFGAGLSEKKFKKNIRKAGKILSEGFALPVEDVNGKKTEVVNGKKAVAVKGQKVAKKAAVKSAKKVSPPVRKNARATGSSAK